MARLSIKTLLPSALALTASAVRLYSADSGGNVTSLLLAGTGTGTVANSSGLSITSRTTECEPNPAVLTLDKANKVLYCYDRGGSKDTVGSFNSLSVADDGTLTRISRVEAPFGGVWGEILTAENGKRAYISASFNASAIGVFALSDNGTLPGTGPLQTISPTIEAPGPVPERQDASYLHHVIIDPTNDYVVIPDLGGDRIRVFAYSLDDIAPLVERPALPTDAGVGPRHGFFRTTAAGDTFLFFNGELSQKIYSYRITYDEAGLIWEKVFEATALGPNSTLPATKAPTSECAMTPDKKFLIVSHREKSFKDSPIFQTGPSDTLSTWAINEDGTLTFLQNAPSGGYSPRQFALNKAGDLLAVGHQNNKTVVVWKRDLATGRIVTEEEGGKVGEVLLTGSVVATIWDE